MFGEREGSVARVAASLSVVVAFAILLAGCGASGAGSSGASETTTAQSAAGSVVEPGAPVALIQVGTPKGLGPVLLDSAHKTIYRFSEDRRGSGVTHCYGRCARVWYPKLSGGTPAAGPGGLDPSLLGTMKRKDGTTQATYDGWPLYTYIREGTEKTQGVGKQAFGGTWYALRANGESVK
jgi:predicted lipoprotein with Yx(FWY)xxD motif